jgi:hypothetical protein
MAYRNVNFITNGFSAVNYNAAGPLGNQFASPFGDPYRVQGTSGLIGDFFSGLGKIGSALLPAAAPIAGAAVSSLLTKAPAPQPTSNPIDTAAEETARANAAAAAAKSNQTVYMVAGAVALVALFYFMSKRRK